MRKAHLVAAALALAASLPVSAQADAVHRRHPRAHAGRVAAAPAQVAPVGTGVGTGPTVPEDPQLGSAIDRASSSIARTDAATRAVTTKAFAPILRLIYPPGQSGDL